MRWPRIDHRNVRKIAGVLYGAGFLLALVGFFFHLALIPGLLLAVAGLAIVMLFWRCPHCGAMLPSREGNIRYCPYCGGKL